MAASYRIPDMRKIFVLLIVTLICCGEAFSYPISPRPLRLLVSESKYIVVGYVTETFAKKKTKDEWGARVARINVLEILQGEISDKQIELTFSPNMICPSPDRYTDKTFVIAFLDKEDGVYSTHALSYGSKTLEHADIAVYKSRIFEMQQILKIQDKIEQRRETIDWLVKCAENEATRWEGTYELSPYGDFMSDQPKLDKHGSRIGLSVSQKERLKVALLATRNIAKPDFDLVDLVYAGNANTVDSFLIRGLKKLTGQDYWMADSFMHRLKHKSDSPETLKIIDEVGELAFEDDKHGRVKTLITKFLQLVDR